MAASTAFFLGLLLGGAVLTVVLLWDRKYSTKNPCSLCEENAQKRKEEEEKLHKEWVEQQKGYKN
jgi:hypothetical protein